MTDKVQKIREKVEKMHTLLPVMDGDNISVNYADRICTTLEMYIDSLQEEPVSEDLEEAAEEYAYTNWQSDDYHDGAAEGLPFDAIGHTEKCFKAGAQWQREQMMKTVVDGKIYETQARSKLKAATIGKISSLKYRVGDKVKLIILKED